MSDNSGIILVILGSAGGLKKTVPGSNPPVTYMTTYVPVLIGLVLVMIALISLPIILVNQAQVVSQAAGGRGSPDPP